MKLSIITVVRDGAQTIRQTIESVIEQNHADIEYIIIDGGSNDGTIDIIKEFDDHITFWTSEPDNGIYDAMNKGLRLATGDVVAFMNSDDWYEKNVFPAVVDFFQKTGADIVYGRVKRIKHGVKTGYTGVFKDFDIQDLYERNIFCHQGMFIKKEIFDEIGLFDLSYKVWADYDWNLKAVTKGKRFELLPLDVANFRYGGLSADIGAAAAEYLSIAQRYSSNNKERKKRINERYRMLKDHVAFEELYERESERFLEVLPVDGEYLIWGAGEYGADALGLLRKLKYHIIGIVDNYSDGEDFYGERVYKPDYIKQIIREGKKPYLIIATSSYEEEIMNQVTEMNGKMEYIITFRQILKWAGEKHN